MSETTRWATALATLLVVSALAGVLRWTNAPWWCWVPVWVFAVKWMLLLVLNVPPDSLRRR